MMRISHALIPVVPRRYFDDINDIEDGPGIHTTTIDQHEIYNICLPFLRRRSCLCPDPGG